MKLSTAALLLASATVTHAAFVPQTTFGTSRVEMKPLHGYLDDLTSDLYKQQDNPDIEGDSKEATNLKKEQLDRFGPGDWQSYRDFGDEFDGKLISGVFCLLSSLKSIVSCGGTFPLRSCGRSRVVAIAIVLDTGLTLRHFSLFLYFFRG
jgi:hypothetical protein